jgi:UDP-N-acetylmuramoyl-tripeptide--D-alanyl-D-alanine ligase
MTDSLFARFLKSTGVSTDTRSIQKDNLFFALKGDNFNANLMASQALEKGAIAIVVDEKTDSKLDYEDGRVILVKDVLISLQKLANVYRKSLAIPIIAVCGSNGKTTTKELIHIVLSKKYKCFATKGNLNNHIGVPLSLLSIDKNTKMAVIEMGANHLQETMLLCNIAEPNYGLITNNGLDHLEGFGSIEGVVNANGELYDYLKQNKGIAFVS